MVFMYLGLKVTTYPVNCPWMVLAAGALHSRYIEVEEVLWAASTAGLPLGSGKIFNI